MVHYRQNFESSTSDSHSLLFECSLICNELKVNYTSDLFWREIDKKSGLLNGILILTLVVTNMYLLIDYTRKYHDMNVSPIAIALLLVTLLINGLNLGASLQMYWRKRTVLKRLKVTALKHPRNWVVTNRRLLFDAIAVFLNLISLYDHKVCCMSLLYLVIAHF